MLPYICDANRKYAGLALKFYEYLISGHPIVTTPYTDLETEDTNLLYIASNASEWSDALEAGLKENDPDKAKRRITIAHRNSYEARMEEQRAILSSWYETHPT